MTKNIRIENADSGTAFKVQVQIYERGVDGAPDVLVMTQKLSYPTDLGCFAIHSSRYAVVSEYVDA